MNFILRSTSAWLLKNRYNLELLLPVHVNLCAEPSSGLGTWKVFRWAMTLQQMHMSSTRRFNRGAQQKYSIPVQKIPSQDWNSFSIRKTNKTGILLNYSLSRYEPNKIVIIRVCRCIVVNRQNTSNSSAATTKSSVLAYFSGFYQVANLNHREGWPT